MSKSVVVVEGAVVVDGVDDDDNDILEAEIDTKRKNYPRLEADCQDKFGHVYYGLPKGIRESGNENEISPVVANIADLLPGETPVAQYDVYFPGKLIPMWLFVIYTVLTFGLFLVYYYCNLWFISKGCCLPTNLEFSRGRLMVTNKDRIIVWKADFNQNAGSRVGIPCLCGLDLFCMRLICGPEPVTYGGDTTTAAYMLKDIAEIVYDSSKTPSYCCGIGGCAGTFSGSIRIYFKKFDTSNLAASTLQCSSVSAYESMANAMFGGGFFFGDTHWNTDYIEITSTKVSESTYDYENRKPEGAFQALAEINNSLNKLVMATRGGQSAWQAPSGACASKLEGAEEVDAKWGSLNIVDEKKVQLPRDYAPLAAGERVVASQSNMYMMTLMDWILSFFTCGLYFVCVVGDKRKIRPALVLTNYRLMEICPSVDNACLTFCPKIIADCCFPVLRGFVVRSLYPRHVFSGVLTREKYTLTATICTDAGSVSVTFDQVPSDALGDELKAESKFGRKLNFCHALMSAATRRAHFKPGEEEHLDFSKEEKVLFPLAEGEAPLARYKGNVAGDVGPCCTKRFSWHPGCCLACTCGVKPMFSDGSMTLTTQTLFVFLEKTNRPFGCWSICMPLVKKFDWQLLWTPLHHVMSTAVDTSLIGRDNCVTRSCEGNFFGQNCCPLNKSVLTVSLKAKTSAAGDGLLTPEVGNIHMFKSLRTDHDVTVFREQIARVQTHLTAVGPAINNVDFLPRASIVGVTAQKMEDVEGSRL